MKYEIAKCQLHWKHFRGSWFQSDENSSLWELRKKNKGSFFQTESYHYGPLCCRPIIIQTISCNGHVRANILYEIELLLIFSTIWHTMVYKSAESHCVQTSNKCRPHLCQHYWDLCICYFLMIVPLTWVIESRCTLCVFTLCVIDIWCSTPIRHSNTLLDS